MTKATEHEDQVLALRREGTSFVKIAADLKCDSARDAVSAYRRAFKRRPKAEQKAIRKREGVRFDAMEKAVRADGDLAPEDAAKRLAKIERLRAAFA